MKQTRNISEALWCDEGVYHIAREMQLLSPNAFDNVFLGLGGFHKEEVVMACLGKHLKGTGIDKVLIDTKIYGPISIETVLNEVHHAGASRAYPLIVEILHVLQVGTFFTDNGKMQYDQFIDCVMCFQNRFQNRQINQCEIEIKWDECELLSCTLEKDFNNFGKKGIKQNIEFAFWKNFFNSIVPIFARLKSVSQRRLLVTSLKCFRTYTPIILLL